MVTSKPRLSSYTTAITIDGVTLPLTVNPRCVACDKVLAHYLAHPYSKDCPRCGALNQTDMPVWLGAALRAKATGEKE